MRTTSFDDTRPTRSLLARALIAASCLCCGVMPQQALAASPSATAMAPTCSLDVGGVPIAYRIVGPAQAPALLLLNRFRGTMDHWDPAVIDRLAKRRRVVMFDQPGFARSGGQPADNLGDYAAKAAEVMAQLGIARFDVMGFSMGGTVALQVLLDHPGRVNKAVIAGSVPGHVGADVPSNTPAGAEVWGVATKPVNNDDDFLFLFFEPSSSSQAAGKRYLARLNQRPDAFAKQVDASAWQAQLKSAMAVGEAGTSLLPRLKNIPQPVFVANGRHDIMAPTYASYAMAQALPNATLKIYPDAGHGFLFQFPEQFAADVLDFLDRAR